MNAVFDCMLLFVWIIHLWLAPFTKVEESFNTQAVHDIIFHQLNISQVCFELLVSADLTNDALPNVSLV